MTDEGPDGGPLPERGVLRIGGTTVSYPAGEAALRGLLGEWQDRLRSELRAAPPDARRPPRPPAGP